MSSTHLRLFELLRCSWILNYRYAQKSAEPLEYPDSEVFGVTRQKNITKSPRRYTRHRHLNLYSFLSPTQSPNFLSGRIKLKRFSICFSKCASPTIHYASLAIPVYLVNMLFVYTKIMLYLIKRRNTRKYLICPAILKQERGNTSLCCLARVYIL